MIKSAKTKKYQKPSNSKSKRILTVYSSQALLQPLSKAPSLTLKKPKQSLIVDKKHKNNSKKQKKRQVSSSNIRQQSFQRVSVQCLRSNTNSEIQFSNITSSHHDLHQNTHKHHQQPQRRQRKTLQIRCGQQTLMKQIWCKQQQKNNKRTMNDAATKIQKVFRGFMTRKLLMKYIDEYEQRLMMEMDNIQRKNQQRNIRFEQDNQNSMRLDQSNAKTHKTDYFSSSRKRNNSKMQQKEKTNHMAENIDQWQAIQDIVQVQQAKKYYKYQRQGQMPYERQLQRQSLTLNQSSIAHQHQQISLSFGQEPQPSPFFHPLRRQSHNGMIPNTQYSTLPTPQYSKHQHFSSQDGTRDGLSQNISNCPSYSKPAFKLSKSNTGLQESNQKITESEIEQSKSRKNLEQFQNKSNIKLYQSKISSGVKDPDWATARQQQYLQKLRSSQKQKWEQVIQLVNSQLCQQSDSVKTKQVMAILLDFSRRNRQQLSQQGKAAVTPTSITAVTPTSITAVTPTIITQRQPQNHSEIQMHGQQITCFKKKSWKEQTLQLQRITKNKDMPLSMPISLPERSQTMKQHFLRSMVLQDQQIDRLISLRESVLRQRQCSSLVQLNNLLQDNQLTQDQFLLRMGQLTKEFASLKEHIQQTKQDISQGYRAQLQLYKCTLLDAKAMGYDVSFCRSMEVFPRQAKWRFDEVMIDELQRLAHRKNNTSLVNTPKQNEFIKEISQNSGIYQNKEESINKLAYVSVGTVQLKQQESSQQQDSSSSVSFTYGQTDIYQKYSPKTFQKSDLIQQQQRPHHKASLSISKYAPVALDDYDKDQQQNSQSSQNRPLKIQTFLLQDSDDDKPILPKHNSQHNTQLAEAVIDKLYWQTIQELFVSQRIRNHLIGSHKMSLKQVSVGQLQGFLQHGIKRMPGFEALSVRLNQKMYPSVLQLLMSMRDQQQDTSVQYYQIGQYEYIINQDICFDLIQSFLQTQKSIKKQHTQSTISQKFKQQFQLNVSTKCRQEVDRYTQKVMKRKQQSGQLQMQILKIQLHMLLDSWNQLLIKYRQNNHGFSGIGLNQLSISLIDRLTRPLLTQQQAQKMFAVTHQQLTSIISNPSLHDKLAVQYSEFVGNDSQWVFYVQQAMEFTFDLLKTIQMELVLQLMEDIYGIHNTSHKTINNNAQGQQLEQEEGHYQGEFRINNESDDSFSNDSLNQDEQMNLRRKIEMMRSYSDEEEDSFYD